MFEGGHLNRFHIIFDLTNTAEPPDNDRDIPIWYKQDENYVSAFFELLKEYTGNPIIIDLSPEAKALYKKYEAENEERIDKQSFSKLSTGYLGNALVEFVKVDACLFRISRLALEDFARYKQMQGGLVFVTEQDMERALKYKDELEQQFERMMAHRNTLITGRKERRTDTLMSELLDYLDDAKENDGVISISYIMLKHLLPDGSHSDVMDTTLKGVACGVLERKNYVTNDKDDKGTLTHRQYDSLKPQHGGKFPAVFGITQKGLEALKRGYI
jgi:hypothetical protein